MDELKRFLQNYKGTQVFNTRNLVGDSMETIYKQNNIQVDYCKDYDYLEIFGLTQKEFNSLVNITHFGYEIRNMEGEF